ncbi:MAG: RNA-directed DNA polymerase [Oceanospirillales bacterium]|nr:RNA-directed DNA polymerase [Oceanospirillales bacterium]MBR9887739.1 RNA-directed DNA polymerase [Oceanospirillales bacterium]
MERSFVARNLRKCITYEDLINQPLLNTPEKCLNVSQEAADLVDDNKVFINSITEITVNNKKAFAPKTIPHNLIIRLLSKNIRDAYNIRVKSRESITSTLITFLKETSSYNIHRLDIKSFYENVDRQKIKNKIKSDGILSKKSTTLLDLFFKELEKINSQGLPRGLSISAVLSELTLTEVDKKITENDEVFFYSRFVDDIVVITSSSLTNSNIFTLISENLPPNLELHKIGNKRHFGNISKSKKLEEKPIPLKTFDYLGYDYTLYNSLCCTDKILDIARRRVDIDISQSKSEKIKQRLIKSFVHYINSSKTTLDYELLIKRLKFITGNYNLVNATPISSPSIKSGIYYNFPNINQNKQLESLDRLIKSLLFNKNSNLSKRIQTNIPISSRRELSHFSFKKGFEERTHHKFSYMDFQEVKKAWL